MLLKNTIDRLLYHKEKLIKVMEDDSKEILFNSKSKEEIKRIIEAHIKELSDILLNDKKNIDILKENSGTYYTEIKNQFIEAQYIFEDKIREEFEKNKFSIDDIIDCFSKLVEHSIKLNNSHRTVPLFMDILGEEQSVTLVGKNGVGKSSFVDDLKKNLLIKTYAIPAQKSLMYSQGTITKKKKEGVKELFREQYLKLNTDQSYLLQSTLDLYSYLIEVIIKDHQASKSDLEIGRASVLDKVNKYFNKLFPYLRLRTDSEEGVLLVENSLREEVVTYGINSLSDGEKSVLFYLCSILLNDAKDVYVIDEPETHLHMALAVELWDLILEEKRESKFIFISHNPQFILTRKNLRVLWCKQYKDIYNNEIVPIEDSLPKEIILELMGTEKTILFCEGAKSSLDYRVYDILYSEKYHIIPVEGHRKVIDFTRVINKVDIVGKKAVGIIDKDFYSDIELKNYKKENIYHLPYTEIEMLLMEESILAEVATHAEKDFNIVDIERVLRTYLKDEKNISREIGSLIKYKLEKEFEVDNIVSQESANKEIDKIILKMENSKQWFVEEKRKLLEFYNNPNTKYRDLLGKCSLKHEITRGIMNRYESGYETRALKAITNKEQIQQILRKEIGIPYK